MYLLHVNYTDRKEKKKIESDMCKLPLAFSMHGCLGFLKMGNVD